MDSKPCITVVSSTQLSFQQASKMVQKFHKTHSIDPTTYSTTATGKGWRVSDDTMEKLNIIVEELKKVTGDEMIGDDSIVDKSEKKKNKKRRREAEAATEKEATASTQELPKQESTPSQQKKKKQKKHDK